MRRIEQLELLVAKLKRAHFGPKSEKAPVNQEQLLLSLSGCVIEAQPPVQDEQLQVSEDKSARVPRKSRALPAHLRREVRTHLPEHTKCPRSEEHTSELQSLRHLVCRLLLEK